MTSSCTLARVKVYHNNMSASTQLHMLTAGLAVLSSVTQALMISSTAIWMAVMLGVICCRSSTTSG